MRLFKKLSGPKLLNIKGSGTVVLVEPDGTERAPKRNEKIRLYIKFNGKNDMVRIHLPVLQNFNARIEFDCNGGNRTAEFGHHVGGVFQICLNQNNANFSVGDNTTATNINANIYYTSFSIGSGCLISNNIIAYIGDGHSILDGATGKAINYPTPTIIGDNVWISYGVRILKGVYIPNGCVVGISTVLSKKFSEENCIIAGNPARVVKHNIKWSGHLPDKYNGMFFSHDDMYMNSFINE